MSVYSMTGYASLQSNPNPDSDLPQPERIGLELRSVNSRFLDLSFKLSDELRGHESALRDLLTRRLRRGKVELRAFLISSSTASASLSAPSAEMLTQLSRAQDQVRAWLPDAAALSVADVLRLAGTTHSKAPAHDSAALVALTEQALLAFLESRAREGERMAAMLRECTAQLRALAATALPLIPALVKAQQQRFMERFMEALQQADSQGQLSSQAAQERALTEAAAFAIRIDVAEELTRLNAHLDEIDSLLQTASAAAPAGASTQRASVELGKRLDFIIQELHREANTLGSKSSTLELSRISVDMKVLIEQMREQVQNIE
jgi:uncharacterized protein (TIGR00255 family)